MTQSPDLEISFQSEALALEEQPLVLRFQGEECISQPYRYTIDLASEDPQLDLEELLEQPASLRLECGWKHQVIRGVIVAAEQGRQGRHDRYYYRVVLAPRMWYLGLSEQSQIYQDLSVPQIVAAELQSIGKIAPGENGHAGLTSEDFAQRLSGRYEPREYTVQYRESDLAFVSRLMEHEGIFYFFEEEGELEKVILADSNVALRPFCDDPEIPYRPLIGEDGHSEEAIQKFVAHLSPQPRKIVLRDYNYRIPHLPFIEGAAVLDPRGVGVHARYGDHFKHPKRGAELAAIRAEELMARKRVFTAEGTCLGLRPGHLFKLRHHYCDKFNREYLVTRLTHEGGRAGADASGVEEENFEGLSYRMAIECIPSDVPFRPARITPKPKVHGIMTAHIDSRPGETYADIDGQGRYRVTLPFDRREGEAGKASRYIRRAQPSAGETEGMHLPLRGGVEVLWACIDGDPDRPIILGAVPNPATASPVTAANHNRSIIRSQNGSFIEFHD